METKIVQKVIFDRDLKIVRRLQGTGRLVVWAGVLVAVSVLFPIRVVGEVLNRTTEWLADRVVSLEDLVGITPSGLRTTTRELIRQVVAK